MSAPRYLHSRVAGVRLLFSADSELPFVSLGDVSPVDSHQIPVSPSAGAEKTMKKFLVTIILPVIYLSLSHLAAGQSNPNNFDAQLLDAAANGDTAALQQLLQDGANIAAKDNTGRTALVAASLNGKAEMVSLLRDRGADSGIYDANPKKNSVLGGRQWRYRDDKTGTGKRRQHRGQGQIRQDGAGPCDFRTQDRDRKTAARQRCQMKFDSIGINAG